MCTSRCKGRLGAGPWCRLLCLPWCCPVPLALASAGSPESFRGWFLEVLSLEGREFPALLWGNPPPAPGQQLFSFLSFFFPFGLNSWLISQLWQRGILSQVSAFPSQARGHGIRAELLPGWGRDGERGEETRRGFGFLTPVAAEGARLQHGGPFSSTTSPDPHPREGSDPLPTGSRAGAAVKGPMPVGMAQGSGSQLRGARPGPRRGAAGSEWERSHGRGASGRACTGHTPAGGCSRTASPPPAWHRQHRRGGGGTGPPGGGPGSPSSSPEPRGAERLSLSHGGER